MDYAQSGETREQIRNAFDSLRDVLLEKNRRYGNSALKPLGVFTAHIVAESEERRAEYAILARLDDKLGRIANAREIRKNDVADLIGYLVLLGVRRGWGDYSDQLDGDEAHRSGTNRCECTEGGH